MRGGIYNPVSFFQLLLTLMTIFLYCYIALVVCEQHELIVEFVFFWF